MCNLHHFPSHRKKKDPLFAKCHVFLTFKEEKGGIKCWLLKDKLNYKLSFFTTSCDICGSENILYGRPESGKASSSCKGVCGLNEHAPRCNGRLLLVHCQAVKRNCETFLHTACEPVTIAME